MEEVSRGKEEKIHVTAAEEDDATSSENPLLRQLVEINQDLTERNQNLIERLHEVEERNRCLMESNRELTERNRALIERNCQLGELVLSFAKK